MTLVRPSFNYRQPIPKFCYHQIVIINRQPPPPREIGHQVYLNATSYLSKCNQTVSLPITRGSSVFMNFSMQEHHAHGNYIVYMAKLTASHVKSHAQFSVSKSAVPKFCNKIFQYNFHLVLRKVIE